jgi:hypothetical protein
MPATPLDAPRRCASSDAGGAIGREPLDAGMVASGASIKVREPGERSTATPSMPAMCCAPRRAVPPLRRERAGAEIGPG